MTVPTRQWVPLAALAVLAIGLAAAFFMCGQKRAASQAPPPIESATVVRPEETLETRTVILYFLSGEDSLLHTEEREIIAQGGTVDLARRILEELLQGPRKEEWISPIPAETRLRELYITDEGVAYVDFSREFQDNHPSGAAAETVTVFSVVNSLARNLESVRRVFILVEGNEKETLKGHVELRRPLLPRFDLVAGGRGLP